MDIELRENEVVEKQISADYWEVLWPIFSSQKRGKYWFTNQRVIFKGGFITNVEIPYSEIESIKKCNVGGLIPIMPTGIKVITKEGKKHYFSVLKRTEIMEYIESKIN